MAFRIVEIVFNIEKMNNEIVFASSIGPTPKKHPDDDDGALIIHNFEKFEPATLIFPFITDYKLAKNLSIAVGSSAYTSAST